MKLAIFDLDGVLVDTSEIHTHALRAAVKQFVPLAYQESYLDASDGVRTVEKLQRLRVDYSLNENDIEAISRMKKKLTLLRLCEIDRNEVIVEIISKLKEEGVKIAIASNSRREFVNIIIKQLGIATLVDCVICGDEVKNPKPHPEIFSLVMNTVGINPASTVIFEDSPSGLEAARKSGAAVVQVDPKILITPDIVWGA